MDIKMNITPETARQIACDLNNKEINFLPETEAFLKNTLNIVNKKCLSLRDEIEEFDEINLTYISNGGK